jgi:hypothetical protein
LAICGRVVHITLHKKACSSGRSADLGCQSQQPGVPFLSGILYLAGVSFMQALFRALLAEARRTGRPIVYLFHSYELPTLFTLVSSRCISVPISAVGCADMK